MRRASRGFTIIETIIYLALFSIIIVGIVSAAYLLFESAGRNQTKSMLQDEKNFVVAKINYALSGAKVASVVGSTLTVVKYDGTSVTVGELGGGMTYAGSRLNNSNTTISDTQFTLGSSPDYVESRFKISAQTAEGHTVYQWATTTVYIRK